jgi:predicted DNA-binding transcriptional regulator AlpA
MAPQFLRFNDLREQGIVSNRMTLQRWIRARGFPAGIAMSPRIRAWASDEVLAWIEQRQGDVTTCAANERRRAKVGEAA